MAFRCETFQSPVLTGAQKAQPTADFVVHCLEVWCVGPVYPADLKGVPACCLPGLQRVVIFCVFLYIFYFPQKI